MKQKQTWFWVALVGVMLAAPNAMLIRIGVDDADPLYWVFIRFVIVALVCLPFMWRARAKLSSRRGLKPVVVASLTLCIALTVYTTAIYLSQASYVAMVSLLTPIIFVVMSSLVIGEQISPRAVYGVGIAATGAVSLVVLPALVGSDSVGFYPLATVLTLINCFAYATTIIYLRKANEAGVPLAAVIGTTALLAALVSAVLFVLFGDWSRTPIDGTFWLAVLYSSVAVALLSRALNVAAYEHVGAFTMGALTYLETFVAILFPVIILSEQITPEMAVGGILILLGVYTVEHHKHPHARHHFIHRQH